ncbi:hypothetical protein [Novosphingobium colocasiae]|uniref:hypothetical protein n=1 Tax=Novosphingobium colocasiae TaxID=1256513 RepID=UPI0035B3FFED
MRRIAATFSVAAFLFGIGLMASPNNNVSRGLRGVNLCVGGERVVYSCQFGAKIGSVCLGRTSLHYRFGRRNQAEIDVASVADWSNIHVGGNRSQVGLNQDFIRFTSGRTHYVVHAGATGPLNDDPGRRISGIEVLEGDAAEEIASLPCKASSDFRQAFYDISVAAPDHWDGDEPTGTAFPMVY